MRKNSSRVSFLPGAKRWTDRVNRKAKQGRHGDSGAVALDMPWYYRNHRNSVNFAGSVPYLSAVAGFCAAFALSAAGGKSEQQERAAKKGSPAAAMAASSSPTRQQNPATRRVAPAATKPTTVASASVAALAPERKTVRTVARGASPARTASPTTSRSGAARVGASARWDRHLNAVPPSGTFLRSFRVRATAYTPINTPMEGGRWTATMRDGRSAHGVAVDPDLIPMGSHLWIPGYGHAIADDTGGAIKGHRIDVRMQNYQEMEDWGVRRIRVYVLRDPD